MNVRSLFGLFQLECLAAFLVQKILRPSSIVESQTSRSVLIVDQHHSQRVPTSRLPISSFPSRRKIKSPPLLPSMIQPERRSNYISVLLRYQASFEPPARAHRRNPPPHNRARTFRPPSQVALRHRLRQLGRAKVLQLPPSPIRQRHRAQLPAFMPTKTEASSMLH